MSGESSRSGGEFSSQMWIYGNESTLGAVWLEEVPVTSLLGHLFRHMGKGQIMTGSYTASTCDGEQHDNQRTACVREGMGAIRKERGEGRVGLILLIVRDTYCVFVFIN